MNPLLRRAPLALLVFATPLLAQTPSPTPAKPAEAAKPAETASGAKPAPAAPLDALHDADLDQILQQLKAHFVSPAALSDSEIKRATIQGLLDRLNPKVSLVTAPAVAALEAGPFKSEVIDNRVGYMRLGAVDAANIGSLDGALKSFTEKKLGAAVLDLRALPGGTTFDLAADVCRRFAPKGKILFTVRQPNAKDQIFTSHDEPLFHGILVVLTSSQTAGNGEIIAGVLRNLAQAMVIGQKTRGEAAGFMEVPLSGGISLRMPVAEFILPGDSGTTTAGIKPDVPVEVSPDVTAEVLKQEIDKGVVPFVLEAERSRLNEAALVSGTNPDLDAMIAAQKAHGEHAKPPLRDVVLQRAMDFVTSVAIYEKGNHGK